MARARNIKPGLFRNADLVELSMAARLLFIGLWTLADRAGRLEDRPKQIKMELLPADEIDCNACLQELASIGVIERYEVDGKRLIQVVNFSKHQNPHKDEKASILPDREGNLQVLVPKQKKHSASTVQTLCEDDGNPADSLLLIPDPRSPIPDSIERPGFVVAGEAPKSRKRSAQPGAADAASTRGSRLPKEWALPKPWGEWAVEHYPHWSPDTVRLIGTKFANHWHAKSGKDATKLDWEATWKNWCMSGITQGEHPPPRASPAHAQQTFHERDAEAKRARVIQMGGVAVAAKPLRQQPDFIDMEAANAAPQLLD
jgi:hypothetical protein